MLLHVVNEMKKHFLEATLLTRKPTSRYMLSIKLHFLEATLLTRKPTLLTRKPSIGFLVKSVASKKCFLFHRRHVATLYG